MLVLKDRIASIRDAVTATTVPEIGRNDVERLELPILSLAEQRRIVADLDDVQARVDALKRAQAESAANLDALLPAVLDRAFRGEL